jgi:hypothetical protein
MTGTKIAISKISLNTQDFSPVRYDIPSEMLDEVYFR